MINPPKEGDPSHETFVKVWEKLGDVLVVVFAYRHVSCRVLQQLTCCHNTRIAPHCLQIAIISSAIPRFFGGLVLLWGSDYIPRQYLTGYFPAKNLPSTTSINSWQRAIPNVPCRNVTVSCPRSSDVALWCTRPWTAWRVSRATRRMAPCMHSPVFDSPTRPRTRPRARAYLLTNFTASR